MALAIVLFIMVTLCGLSPVSMECVPPKEEKTHTLEWKVMKSDLVAHGVVNAVESDPESLTDTYTVTFELRCIYKGGKRDELIRISQVGYNPSNCLSTNLTIDLTYLVYLKETDNGQYIQEFKPDPGDPQYLDEIVVVCEVTVSYPNGFDENNNKEECPEEYELEDCLPRPILANPPYSEDDQSSPLPEDTINQQTKDEKDVGEGGDGAPNKSLQPPGMVQGNGNNGSTSLTLSLSALFCLLLVTILTL